GTERLKRFWRNADGQPGVLVRTVIDGAHHNRSSALRIRNQQFLVRPPSLYFFGRHMLDVIIPSHCAIKARWVQTADSLINPVRPGRKRQLVVGFDAPVSRPAEYSQLSIGGW